MRSALLAGLLALATIGTAEAEELVLYTSQPNADAQATADGFMAANPGITVTWVRDGTPKIMARLMAEFAAGHPAADVLLIADTVTLERLKQAGRLLAYHSPEAAHYDPALYDRDGYYYSTKLITTGIVYNTAASLKPTSWRDLTRPEAKGLVTLPSPVTSGAALIHAQTLAAIHGLGWDYYQALKDNGATAAGGNGAILKAVASGEKAYGMVVDYLPIREAAKGAPVQFVFPTEGVSAVTEPVAILATTPHAAAAQKFIDYVLSEAGQQGFVKLGYLPARNGMAPPPGFPPRDQIKLLPIDAAAALQASDSDLKHFTSLFGDQ